MTGRITRKWTRALAFTLTPTGGKSHVGVVTLQMQSAVNMDDHTVFLSNPAGYKHFFPFARSRHHRPDDRTDEDVPQSGSDHDDFAGPAGGKREEGPGTAAGRIGQQRSADDLHQHEAGDPASGQRRADHGAHRRFQFAVRCECELAGVRRAGKFELLPVRQQGLAHGLQPARYLDADHQAAEADVEGSAECELRRSESLHSPTSGQRCQFPHGVLQRHSGGNRCLRRPAAVDSHPRHAVGLRIEYRERGIQVHPDRSLLFPDLGTLVYRPRILCLAHGRLRLTACLPISPRSPPAVLPERSWLRCRARRKPKTRC